MPKSRSTAPRIGKYFLKSKAGIWYVSWYDRITKQTRGNSTGTGDLRQAELKLAEYALRNSAPDESALDCSLADALAFYWFERGQNLASAQTYKIAMRHATEILGDIRASDLTPVTQKRFIAELRSKGHTDGNIARLLGCIWAALNLYNEEGRLKIVPARIGMERWKANFNKRERVLTLAELARLLNSAASHEHRWRYILLAIGTGSRPKAILELSAGQVDLESGIIHLNAPGRRQTKKRRPSVPMATTLAGWAREWLQAAGNGPGVLSACASSVPVVGYRGEVMTSDTWFDNLTKEAGVDCVPYDIRHTVITWLVRKGVPSDEREVFIGHRLPGSATTEGYVHLDPGYLEKAAGAIEELFQALGPLVTARDLLRTAEIEEQPVPASVAGEVEQILSRLRSNAT